MNRITPLLCLASLVACQSAPKPEAQQSQAVENSGLRGIVITVDRLE